MGRQVKVPFPPQRIVSLVPSQTELLASLGLDAEVVGITKFCIHPNTWFRNKSRVGGTKDFKLERIRKLRPDLIIGNKEENDQAGIEQLAKEFPVWMSDIKTLDDARDMIGKLGEICARPEEARKISAEIESGFANTPAFPTLRTAYLIWQDPIMIAASDTFINHLIETLGLENVFSDKSRYPIVTEAELQEKDPELILLSSEPFPFREKHLERFQAICPKARVKLADGSIFSWYGSRLLKAPAYFADLRKSLKL
ncbi:MAG: ABC transporter substrate-binding protein [Bacteroidetes bacterium]|nr:ABC transporter substrate-binding protein [Bacteroidota bacterium]